MHHWLLQNDLFIWTDGLLNHWMWLWSGVELLQLINDADMSLSNTSRSKLTPNLWHTFNNHIWASLASWQEQIGDKLQHKSPRLHYRTYFKPLLWNPTSCFHVSCTNAEAKEHICSDSCFTFSLSSLGPSSKDTNSHFNVCRTNKQKESSALPQGSDLCQKVWRSQWWTPHSDGQQRIQFELALIYSIWSTLIVYKH